MDFIWGVIGCIIIFAIILVIMWILNLWIPVLLLIIAAIIFGILFSREEKKKVKNGRLTKEILSFLEKENASSKNTYMLFESKKVCATIDSKVTNFDLVQELTLSECKLLAHECMSYLGKESFKLIYHEAVEPDGYYQRIGSIGEEPGRLGSTDIYGDYIPLTEGAEAYYSISPKEIKVKQSHAEKPSNW